MPTKAKTMWDASKLQPFVDFYYKHHPGASKKKEREFAVYNPENV